MSGELLRWSACFEIPITIRKPDYSVCICYVQELWLVTWRIKSDSERLIQIVFGERFGSGWFSAAVGMAQNLNLIFPALYDKNIAVRRGEKKTWITESTGIQFAFEASWDLWSGICRTIDNARPINCQNV
jgi:hypothetical protein